MNTTGKLRTVNEVIALTLAVAKYAADHQRHGTHKRHNQQCMCLTQCTLCIIATIRDRFMMAQAAKMAEKMASPEPRIRPAGA